MRIIGIDPGTATTGFGIVENKNGNVKLLEYGCIRTQAGLAQSERLRQISEDLETLIKKWQPDKASIEKLFFNKNIKTAMTVSEARGVILQKLAEKGISTNEYSPLEIKSTVCGYGKADKKMIQQMIKMSFGLKEAPKSDDAADAIAAALCLVHTNPLL